MTGEEHFKELYRKHIHREGAEELLLWLEQETDFFTAPASTKHHLAYPGGLVEHSVNVFRELRKVVIDNEPTMESVAICGLLHDVCKANTYVREYHAGPGEVLRYVKKDNFPMGHGEKIRVSDLAVSAADRRGSAGYPLAHGRVGRCCARRKPGAE